MLRTGELRSITMSHNHPGLSYFSYDDIGKFIQYPSIRTLAIVTNQGKVWYLTKKESFDDLRAFELYNDIGRKYNGKREKDAVAEFLEELYNFVERN